MSKAIILLIKLIGSLPVSFRKKIGSLLGSAAFLLLNNERKITRLQITKILGANDSNKIARNVFKCLGSNLLLSLNLKPLLKKSNQIISVTNQELFEDLKDCNQHMIALTAHTGNWDLLAAYNIQEGVNLVTIGRPIRNPILQDVLINLREEQGIKTLWRNSLTSSRKLIEIAKSGSTIAALIDQDTKVKSIESNFFSTPSKTPIGLIELGLKHNARFITAFLFEEENGNYTFYINEIHSRDIQLIVDEYHKDLEALLQKYPEQWVWFHKRWRTQGKKTMSSKEYINYLEAL